MGVVDLVVIYGGDWEFSGGIYKFIGGTGKGFVVNESISYEDFLEKIYKITGIDRTSNELLLKFVYNTHFHMEPLVVSNEDDLQFFLRQNDDARRPDASRKPGTPLCITLRPKEHQQFHSQDASYVPETQPFVGRARNRIDDFPSLSQFEEDFDDVRDGQGREDNINDEYDDDIPFVGGASYVPETQPFVVDDVAATNDPNAQTGENIQVGQYSGSNTIDLNSESSDTFDVGVIFTNKKELHKHISLYAIKKNFQFRVTRSTKSLLVVECLASGCQWRMRGIKLKETELFLVKKFNDTYTCSLEFVNHGHKQASGRVIGDCIRARYEGVGRVYRPNDIIQDIRREYGINITYDKAWRARECALYSLRGSPEESFAYLPHYCAVLENNNPGTITHIESDDDNRFKYFFMAIGASLRGFHSSMRPVIVVDGTHLKGKYLGTLFVATALDGNEQIYPVAFGIGDSENNASWQWFFEKLRDAITVEDFSRLCIISDRNPSIDRAVSLVLPGSFHGACIVHIQRNMKAKGFNESIIPIYLKAAKVYRTSEFEHLMNQLRNV
ncbi:uncharacterized protein LOC120012596 [Tripterygium wilfordii]|uniref:uncharacterized protein LOC120012596 n=1 Tax=Tripterygium wilfordii TaxID=458696 RepID=UPI0018F820F1|nr:uncharacterized protein LOC120012596 [Tripterygium wilfordii]